MINLIKHHFVIYADLECIIEKIDGCKSNPENSSKTKVNKHIPSGFLISSISSFKSINKCDIYRGKYCMRKFCEFLREDAMKMINFRKKKIKLLTREQHEFYENAKSVIFLKRNLKIFDK